MPRVLAVTAAAAERDAVLAGRSPAIGMVDGIEVHRATTAAGLLDVIAAGIGPVAAAVATGCALRSGYDLVINAGVAGGFPAAEVAGVVVGNAVIHADLGAQTPDGFSSMAELGWGPVRFELDDLLCAELARRTNGVLGSVLSVSTVTGTQARADELHKAHPDAVAEAMEGIGVYSAAAQVGVPFAEIRTISNRVGPRRRDEWRIADALTALTQAFDAALAAPLTMTGGW
jgi:futalosine hydrolase